MALQTVAATASDCFELQAELQGISAARSGFDILNREKGMVSSLQNKSKRFPREIVACTITGLRVRGSLEARKMLKLVFLQSKTQ